MKKVEPLKEEVNAVEDIILPPWLLRARGRFSGRGVRAFTATRDEATSSKSKTNQLQQPGLKIVIESEHKLFQTFLY